MEKPQDERQPPIREKNHPFTNQEMRLGITRQEVLRTPRRCPNGHLCELWPCLTCNPHIAW
jgi:hypothetical protein